MQRRLGGTIDQLNLVFELDARLVQADTSLRPSESAYVLFSTDPA
jgi:hypothetical protein